MNPNTKKSGTSPETREKTTSPPPAFDTLQAVRKLKNAEFGEKQAVTLVETLQDAQNELATKVDWNRWNSSCAATWKGTAQRHGGDGTQLRSDFENRFTELHRFLLIGGGVMTTILSVVITLAITLAK